MIYKRALICKTKNLCDFTKLFNSTIDKQFRYLGFWQVEISVKSNTEYTLSRLNNDVINLGTTYLGMDNVSRGEHTYSCWLNHQGVPSYCRKSITLTSSSDGKLWIFFSSAVYNAYKNGQNPFGYLQLEEGSTPTNYVPYGYLQSYKKAIKVSDIFVESYRKYLKIKENNNA